MSDEKPHNYYECPFCFSLAREFKYTTNNEHGREFLMWDCNNCGRFYVTPPPPYDWELSIEFDKLNAL